MSVECTSPVRDQPLGAPLRAPAGVNRVLALLLPMALTLYANFNGVQLILAPLQVEAIDPAGKIQNLAWLTMICAITGVAGLTAGGAASDATRSRWGRRSPWLAAMALGLDRPDDRPGAAARFRRHCDLLRRAVVHAQFLPGRHARGDAGPRAGFETQPRLLDPRASRGRWARSYGVNLAAFAPGVLANAALAATLVLTTATFVIFAREAPFLAPKSSREAARPGLRLVPSFNLLRSFSSRDFSLAYLFRVLDVHRAILDQQLPALHPAGPYRRRRMRGSPRASSIPCARSRP